MTGGILLVDKPRGWTSHDVVGFVRSRLPRGTKVGHSGTLDPMATGLLILLVGKATKLAAGYQRLPKVYSGSVRLGLETTTGDLEGQVLGEAPLPPVDEASLRALFESLVGELEMPVPRFSAVKHQGRPLYDYARKGEEVPEKLRTSRVMECRLLSWSAPEAGFRLRCSSGTYVRSLAVLVGRRLGCGATLSALRRESVGSFRVEDAVPAESLRAAGAEDILRLVSPPSAASV